MNLNLNLIMTKEEIIKSCRFYQGEPSNPYEGQDPQKAMIWDYERIWVRNEGKTDTAVLDVYKAYGLESFSNEDGVPMSLKTMLFNRFMHWKGGYGVDIDREAFKRFYLQSYLGE